MLIQAAASEQIRVDGTFVTVDPERDTSEILSKYTKNFGPAISYLRFEGDELERFKAISAWKRFSIPRMQATNTITRSITALQHS